MSKLVAPAASGPPAAAAPPPAYGAAAMKDLIEFINWSGCEVLNSTKPGVDTVLKQGLRDQPEMIMESDSDADMLISIAFTSKCVLCIASRYLSLPEILTSSLPTLSG